MRLTLQGLLEEHIEMLLDDREVLPEPTFQSLSSLDESNLPDNAGDLQITSFTVLVPSTADR